MNKLSTLKRILSYVKPYKLYVITSFLCALVTAGAGLLIPIFCGKAIDYMLGAGQVLFEEVFRFALYVAVAAIVIALAQQLLSFCNNKITYYVSRDLRNASSQKLHSLPLSYLDTHPSGDILSRILTDSDTVSDGLLMGFSQLFTGIITIIGTLAIMLYYNLAITLIVVILTPLSLFVASFIAKRTHRYFTAQASARGKTTALINELVDGQKVVQAYGSEEQTMQSFDVLNEELKNTSLKATFFSSLTNPSTRLVNNIVYAGVCLASALFTVSGKITIGQLSVFLSYASQYAKPFNEISGVVTELQNALACAERIFELLDAPEQTAELSNPKQLSGGGRVELNEVCFRYVPEKPLIENVNLAARAGQRIAIVGKTGCGKTTLINLLMRFYDVNAGAICVDGVDIRETSRKTLRAQYGMVLQDTWLKSGTIRENIAYGKPEASEEEIIQAAKKAHAHSFIRRMPNGYETVITENGDNLSAGQKQLLCIARVMLCLPPMLILDEATSSIDARTEIRIQKAFKEMMEGRTSFIVAHRLSTIREADLILAMDHGKIVEQGNHEQLLQKGGFYSQLYNSQFAVE
ncbi:MAG: ABC transporter ATP-binding protein [Clostridia bacterium]|nr:ABC transporter ATP-binding protein [Clostridia bacterium]